MPSFRRNPTPFLLIPLLLLTAPPLALAAQPTWAKKAVAFPEECRWDDDFGKCKSVRIPSPDGNSMVEVHYRKEIIEGDQVLKAYLRVTTPLRRARGAALPSGFQDVDLLWSPDSKSFFVNGGDGGAYWGFWVYVYVLSDEPLKARNLTFKAQRDMVKAFPPCKASNRDEKLCKTIKASPEYNMSGIDWAGPSAIVVMAEVPCSSTYGGIMCEVMGYELQVPTGRILKRIDATRLKVDWQKSMAWKFQIPEPPEYGEPHRF